MFQSPQLSNSFLEIILHLFRRQISAFFIIFGRRGSGKTDFALFLAEILIENHVVQHVATNIDVSQAPFHIEQITNLDDLKDWAKTRPGKKLFLFDEIAKAMPRRRPMATLTVDLLNEFQILRKYKLSVVATTITEDLADSGILDPNIVDGYFKKPSWENPKLAYFDDQLERLHKSWHHIPKTSVKYDTYSSAPFEKHGKRKRPVFKEKELQDLWDLTHGMSARDVGLKHTQIARLWRKFVKDKLEEGLTSNKS